MIKLKPSKHSRYSPSSAFRVLACPASLRREEKYPSENTRPGALGTILHYIAAECLTESIKPREFIGKTFLSGRIKIILTEYDIKKIKAYVVYCSKLRGRVEKKLKSNVIVAGQFGRVDFISETKNNTLIVDLKTGFVHVDDFTQLKIYALLHGKKHDYALSLFQAGYGLKTKLYTYKKLKKFAERMRLAYAVAEKSKARANAGTHCTYCRAKVSCVEHAEWENKQLIQALTFKGGHVETAQRVYEHRQVIKHALENAEKILRLEAKRGRGNYDLICGGKRATQPRLKLKADCEKMFDNLEGEDNE